MMVFMLVVIALTSLILLAIQSVKETSFSYQEVVNIHSSFSYFKLKKEYIFYYRTFSLEVFQDVTEEQVLSCIQREGSNEIKDVMVSIAMNQKEANRHNQALSQLSFLGTARTKNRYFIPKGIYRWIENELIKKELKNHLIVKPIILARVLYTGPELKRELVKDFYFNVDELVQLLTN